MRVKKEYHEIIIIGKKPKHRQYRIFVLFFAIFLIIFLLLFFSIKSLFFVPTTASVNYYILYAAIDAKTYETAETKAVEYKARGGAGVVIKKDKNFGVVLAIYPDNLSAQTVVKQLEQQDISAQIEVLKLPTFSLNNMSENDSEITQHIHQKYIDTLQNLYDLSYDLDTSQISQSYALMRINELALLWEQRSDILASKIDTVSNSESAKHKHALYPIYCLALYVASQLKYLANENTYQDSLKTLISVIRQTNYMLCVLEY